MMDYEPRASEPGAWLESVSVQLRASRELEAIALEIQDGTMITLAGHRSSRMDSTRLDWWDLTRGMYIYPQWVKPLCP